MRRIFVVIIIVWIAAAVLMPKANVFAQDDLWREGCHEQTEAVVAEFVGDMDFDAACEGYYNCMSFTHDVTSCEPATLNAIVEGCAEADCEQDGLFLTAAIAFFEEAWDAEETPPQVAADLMPQILQAYQDGDYADALADLQTIERETDLPEAQIAKIMLMAGLAQEALDTPGEALATYNRAMEIYVIDPLVWYARVMLLAEIGYDEEVAFEAERVMRYLHLNPWPGNLIERLQVVMDKYPFPFDQAQNWLAYPYKSYIGGGGGYSRFVYNQLPPIPVALIKYAPTGGIVITGLEAIGDAGLQPYCCESSMLGAEFFFRRDSPPGYLRPEPRTMFYASLSLNALSADERVFSISSANYDTDGVFERTLLLVPEGAPDPRVHILGPRCGIISHLRQGAKVNYAHAVYQVGAAIYDAPGGTEIGRSFNFTILDEYQCIDNATFWWLARSEEGVVGWVQENEGHEYLLNSNGTSLIYCPGVPEPRLVGGDSSARVVKGAGANNIRDTASRQATVVAQMPEGATFTVIRGAVCADGYLWWYVNYNGVEGWTAEGLGDAYWLEPIYEEASDEE